MVTGSGRKKWAVDITYREKAVWQVHIFCFSENSKLSRSGNGFFGISQDTIIPLIARRQC